ncbi:hypothetical protein RFI_23868 [Reticulomyxa filosa]|uniref:Uncharacterized protein n=1 Tax=Reticulomyxa filosa TaxID=46433 RepID=X6MKA6_RETFI|nr:hypothetical protein RFI_23868 [Reticulomyxa filosa]|eukprot:ETO13500.1 hypothetical protein RFI_23868 [Reticulomyxa filosa]
MLQIAQSISDYSFRNDLHQTTLACVFEINIKLKSYYNFLQRTLAKNEQLLRTIHLKAGQELIQVKIIFFKKFISFKLVPTRKEEIQKLSSSLERLYRSQASLHSEDGVNAGLKYQWGHHADLFLQTADGWKSQNKAQMNNNDSTFNQVNLQHFRGTTVNNSVLTEKPKSKETDNRAEQGLIIEPFEALNENGKNLGRSNEAFQTKSSLKTKIKTGDEVLDNILSKVAQNMTI